MFFLLLTAFIIFLFCTLFDYFFIFYLLLNFLLNFFTIKLFAHLKFVLIFL